MILYSRLAIRAKYADMHHHADRFEIGIRASEAEQKRMEDEALCDEQKMEKMQMVKQATESIKEKTNHKLWVDVPQQEKNIEKARDKFEDAVQLVTAEEK